MSKKQSFRTLFENEHTKGAQTLLKSDTQIFHQIFSSIRGRLCCRYSLLVICEILGLLVNTLTADDNYYLHKSENSMQVIQIALPKQINFFF